MIRHSGGRQLEDPLATARKTAPPLTPTTFPWPANHSAEGLCRSFRRTPLVCVAEVRLNVGPRFSVVRGYQEMSVVTILNRRLLGSSCVPRRPATTYAFSNVFSGCFATRVVPRFVPCEAKIALWLCGPDEKTSPGPDAFGLRCWDDFSTGSP